MYLKLSQVLMILVLAMMSCNAPTPSEDQAPGDASDAPQLKLDLQGHRGARGLLPENSLPAMRKAVELGVTTLETDVVITQDHRVVLSHEPFMSHEFCLDPSGNPIAKEEERSHNIYQMDLATVQSYDCGSKAHPRFPDQEKMRVSKPLLADVVDMAEALADSLGREPLLYNIEIKRVDGNDGVFHPDAKTYAQLLLDVIHEKGIQDRTTIQSFDVASLEETHKIDPEISTAYLIGSNSDFEGALALLSFTPSIYSPNFNLVTAELIAYAQEHNMQVIPWTVNELADMERLVELGVDGLISDFPDRFKEEWK